MTDYRPSLAHWRLSIHSSRFAVHRLPAFPRLLLSSAAMPELNLSPVALLRAHAQHAPWNARGLAAHVTALVDAAGKRPTKAPARAHPSARPIKLYVPNGLLRRPPRTGDADTPHHRPHVPLCPDQLTKRRGPGR